MANTQAYLEWLSSGNAVTPLVETIQIAHPKWGIESLANWDQNLTCRVETGADYVFMASRFYMEPADLSDNTGQSTILTMATLDGLVYNTLRDMTIQERNEPIIVTYRSYLLNNLTEQVINPPPRWTIHAIEATNEAVRAEIRSEPLRVRRVGIYYTEQNFPVLVYR